MDRSSDLNELFKALSVAQGEIKDASKDKTNPHFGQKYADMAAALQASREVLARHGICVLQLPSYDAQVRAVNILTIVGHSSGQSISEVLQMPVAQPTAQGVGSAITYGRRYAYMAAVGIAPDDDDDGNAASGRPGQQQNRPQTKPAPQANPTPKPAQQQPPTPIQVTKSTDVPPRIADMISAVKTASEDERAGVLGRVIGELYADMCDVVGDEQAASKTESIMASVGVRTPAEIARPSQLRTVLMGMFGTVQHGLSAGGAQ